MTCNCCGAPPPVLSWGGTVNGKHADQWNVGNFIDELFINGVNVFALTNVVSVESADDFPAAVAGVRTPDAGVLYIINGFVNMGTDTFSCTSGTLNFIGRSNIHDGLIYTGTGTFVTCDASFFTRNLTFTATSSSSTFLSTTGTNVETLVFQSSNVSGFGTLGAVDDVLNFVSIISQWTAFGKGFLFTGANNGSCFLQSSTFIANANTGTLVDFGTAVFEAILIETGRIETFQAGQIGVDGAASSANLSVRGSIAGVVFEGPGNHTNGILNSDLRWRFVNNFGNQGTEDSINHGAMTMQSNATATPVGGGWPQKTLGTRVTGNLSRFTFNSNGTLTYVGLTDIRVNGIINCSPQVTAGANQTIALYPALNGSVLTAFASTVVLKTGDVKSVTIPFEVNMSTNDTLDMWINNTTSSISVLIVAEKFLADGF